MTTNQLITKIGRQRVVTALANVVCQGGSVSQTITQGVTTSSPSENAVFDALALKANLASPALTGNPTAPTQSAGDNSTKIATTAYVDTAASGTTEATLAEALAGTSTTTRMSPRRTRNVTERVYNVEAYGALHDYQTVSVANITSGTDDLTVSSGTPFTSADVGKTIRLFGAGAAGADLITTITAFVSSTAVTIGTNASTTITNKQIEWATDDTPFIQAAINAAFAAYGGTVYFPNGIYYIAGNLVTSVDGVNPNAQIYFPLINVTAGTDKYFSIKLLGESVPSQLTGPLADVDMALLRYGVILKSPIVGSGSVPAVIGSSFYTPSVSLNLLPVSIENISVQVKAITGTTSVEPTMTAFKLRYQAFVQLDNNYAFTESSVWDSAQPSTVTYGFDLPGLSTAEDWGGYIGNITAIGFYTGFGIVEHINFVRLHAVGCVNAVEINTGGGHPIIGGVIASFGCINGIVFNAAKRVKFSYWSERYGAGKWYQGVNDISFSTNHIVDGEITGTATISGGSATTLVVSSVSNILGTLRIIDMKSGYLSGTNKVAVFGGQFPSTTAAQGGSGYLPYDASKDPAVFEINRGIAAGGTDRYWADLAFVHLNQNTSNGTVGRILAVNRGSSDSDKRMYEMDMGVNGSAVDAGRVTEYFNSGTALTQVTERTSSFNKQLVTQIIDADISPTALAANTDNYAPTGIATAATLRISASSGVDLTGIAGGATMVDGRELTVINVGTTNTITLKTDVTSTAANRFLLNADFALAANMAVKLVYDGTSLRWRKTY